MTPTVFAKSLLNIMNFIKPEMMLILDKNMIWNQGIRSREKLIP